MASLDHRNVVKLYQAFLTKTKFVIVMELVTGGELLNRVNPHEGLPESTARYYFRQLISGLHHCHSCGVFHRDLKVRLVLQRATVA